MDDILVADGVDRSQADAFRDRYDEIYDRRDIIEGVDGVVAQHTEYMSSERVTSRLAKVGSCKDQRSFP